MAASLSLNVLFQSPILRASEHLLRCFSTASNFCNSAGSGCCPGTRRCRLAFSTCPNLQTLQELYPLIYITHEKTTEIQENIAIILLKNVGNSNRLNQVVSSFFHTLETQETKKPPQTMVNSGDLHILLEPI